MNAFTFTLGLVTNDHRNLIIDQGLTRANIGSMIAMILADHHMSAFNLTWGDGYWDGAPEPTVDIYVSGIDATHARIIAADLASCFHQDCVGFRLSTVMTLITPERSLYLAQ